MQLEYPLIELYQNVNWSKEHFNLTEQGTFNRTILECKHYQEENRI